MSRSGYIVALILLFSGRVLADNFVSVFPGRPAHAHFGIGLQFDSNLFIDAVNSDSVAADTLTVIRERIRVDGDPSEDYEVMSPAFSVVTIHLDPGESRREALGSLRSGVRVSGTNYGDYDFLAVYRVTVTSALTGVSSSFEFHQPLAGTISSGSPGLNSGSPFEFTFDNAAPVRQVWYSFGLANMTSSAKEARVYVTVDTAPILFETFTVESGSVESPNEQIFSGAIVVPGQFLNLDFPGGILMNGVSSWDAINDEGAWEAAIVFPESDPEEMRLRLGVDVFSDAEMELIVRDGYGNEIDRLSVIPGLYSTSVDLAFSGIDGHEVTFEIAGSEGYAVSIARGTGTLSSGTINNLGIQIHKADDPPTTIGGTTTMGTGPDGRPVATEIRIYNNGLGTLTAGGQYAGPWNPDPRFGGTYIFGDLGDGGKALLAIDAAIAQVAANGSPIPSLEGEESYSGTLGDMAAGLRDGIGSLPVPEAVPAAMEDEWTIQLPPIGGIEVPVIVVPLTHPAVGWLRMLMLILVYAMWLEKTIRLIKT